MKITIKENTPKVVGIEFNDLRDGDLFQFQNFRCCEEVPFGEEVFLMLDKAKNDIGQAYDLTKKRFTWFQPDVDVTYRLFKAAEFSDIIDTKQELQKHRY